MLSIDYFSLFTRTKNFQVRIGPPKDAIIQFSLQCLPCSLRRDHVKTFQRTFALLHSLKINQVTLKADDQAFRSAEVQSFQQNFHMVWTLVNLQYNWFVFFQNVRKLKYNIKVTTYSMLLPDVGIVKILLSCFTIPIATIFIATFIRGSLIVFVEFHFFKVTGTF